MTRHHVAKHVRRQSKHALLLTLVFALGVPIGGVAYGFWTAGGAGAATGLTGSTVPIALAPGAPAANLYPGGQTNVVLTVSNPNTAQIHINSLNLNSLQGTGGYSVDVAHSGCGVGVLTYTTQTNGGAGWNVPPKVGAVDGTLSVTLSNALAMSSAAASACQGATFTVYLAVS
jgi:hypothetical protein